MTVQKGMVELVGRSDSDWARDSATRQSVTGSLQCTRSNDGQQEPETDSNQSPFLRSRVLRSQHLRRKTSGSRKTLRRTSLQRFGSSRDGIRFPQIVGEAIGASQWRNFWMQICPRTSKSQARRQRSMKTMLIIKTSASASEFHMSFASAVRSRTGIRSPWQP